MPYHLDVRKNSVLGKKGKGGLLQGRLSFSYCRSMLAVAGSAQGFEVVEMVRATDRTMLPPAWFAVVDFQPDLLAPGAPQTHRIFVGFFSA